MKLPKTAVAQIPKTPNKRLAWQRPVEDEATVTVVYQRSSLHSDLKCVRLKERPSAEM